MADALAWAYDSKGRTHIESTGISGAADSTFILQRDKRTENAATLFCAGRDIKTLSMLSNLVCRLLLKP